MLKEITIVNIYILKSLRVLFSLPSHFIMYRIVFESVIQSSFSFYNVQALLYDTFPPGR